MTQSKTAMKTKNNSQAVIKAIIDYQQLVVGDLVNVTKIFSAKRKPRTLHGVIIQKSTYMITVQFKNRKESFSVNDVISKTVILQRREKCEAV